MRLWSGRKPVKQFSRLETIVPGRAAIQLAKYYTEFCNYYPLCELQTKRWFVENIRPEWTCIDAGANIGYHSILMAQCAPRGQVFAFEPTSTYDMLLENLRINGVTNVQAENIALSDKCGLFAEPIFRIWGQPPERFPSNFTTIDTFVERAQLERIDLIKIDVDGFDLEVLKGASRTLARFRPVVIIEINEALKTRGYTPTDVMTFMLDHKYGAAQILDLENYVFTSDWDLGMPWPSRLSLTIDHRDPLASAQLTVHETLSEIDREWIPRNSAEISRTKRGLRALSHDAKWSYVASQKFRVAESRQVAVRVSGQMTRGALGILLTSADGKIQESEEVMVKEPGEFTRLIPVRGLGDYLLVLRTVSDSELEFELWESSIVRTEPAHCEELSLDHYSSRSLARTLDVEVGKNWDAIPLSRVQVMSTEELTTALGQTTYPAECPRPSANRDPRDLVMERDDAAVLQWIYQTLQPQRHLEFGTWEGFGTLLCLRSSSAHVWTINLPEGETTEGEFIYDSSREPNDCRNPNSGALSSPSDRAESIGWMYREVGQAQRVTQVLADSREYQLHPDLVGKFDTVFIDGSHHREDVSADQAKALAAVGRQGIVIWHDFTLNPRVVRGQPACVGVIAAIADEIDSLTAMGSLVWIENTLLLMRLPEGATSRRHGTNEGGSITREGSAVSPS